MAVSTGRPWSGAEGLIAWTISVSSRIRDEFSSGMKKRDFVQQRRNQAFAPT
jgi:hypothetical protein